jgi:hypothetical protein
LNIVPPMLALIMPTEFLPPEEHKKCNGEMQLLLHQ